MKRIMIILMILTMMLSMAACGEKTEADKPVSDETETVEAETATTDTLTEVPKSEEDEEFVKMFELTNIEYVLGNGETKQADFIPGSEVYIFRDSEDGLRFEYKYKNYPTEEDMLNDRNYTIENVRGAYTLNPDHTQLFLVGDDGSFRQAAASEDKIIFEYSPEGYDAKMVTTYTETDKISF